MNVAELADYTNGAIDKIMAGLRFFGIQRLSLNESRYFGQKMMDNLYDTFRTIFSKNLQTPAYFPSYPESEDYTGVLAKERRFDTREQLAELFSVIHEIRPFFQPGVEEGTVNQLVNEMFEYMFELDGIKIPETASPRKVYEMI